MADGKVDFQTLHCSIQEARTMQGGGENAVAGIGKKCGKMRKKCGKCEKKCGIKCGFAKML